MPSDLAELFDLKAEETLLGNLLVDPSAIPVAAEILSAVDFGNRDYGALFDALVQLQRARLPVGDTLVLVPELRRMRLPEAVTSGAFIARVIGDGVAHHEKFYATRIRELAQRRRLVAIADRLRQQATDPSVQIEELQLRARAAVDSVGVRRSAGMVTIGDAAKAVVAELRDRRDEVGGGGACFGLSPLDCLIGPMKPGEFWVLAARPGNGKTSLALQAAAANARAGRRALIVSLEMSAGELATRELCGESGIDSRRLRTGSLDQSDLEALEDAAQSLEGLPVDIWSAPSADVTAVRATALVAAARGDLGLVVLDYLSLLKGNHRTVWERIADQSAALKSLAKEINAPVLCLSQFNRDAEGERPSLAMLRYGGSVEQDADGVIALHPADADSNNEEGDAFEVLVLKNRHGAVGTINATFDRVATRFVSPVRPYDEFTSFNQQPSEPKR